MISDYLKISKKELNKLIEEARNNPKFFYDKYNQKYYKIAKVIFYDEVHIIVICPHCYELHIHGSCGGTENNGHRVADCGALGGYIIGVEEFLKNE